jgi:hypothetical protein
MLPQDRLTFLLTDPLAFTRQAAGVTLHPCQAEILPARARSCVGVFPRVPVIPPAT